MLRRWRKTILISLLVLGLGFVLLNAVAYRHAWKMTHFVAAETRTEPPESLTTTGKIKVLLTGVSIPRPQNKLTPEYFGLGYKTHKLKVDTNATIEAWQIFAGDRKGSVILFPGYAAAKDSLLEPALYFHKQGYDCWLVDFRGCGGSSGDWTSIGWYEAEDVAAVYKFAKAQSPAEHIVLYGASLGAASILRAVARENIQPDGLILECPFNRLLDTAGNRFRAMKLPAFPLANLLVFWGGRQLGFNGFTHNPAEYAKSVHCPTLLMNGDSDTRVTPANSEAIRRNLPVNTQFHLFKNTGHESYLRKHPAEWEKLAGSFLSSTERH